MSECEKECVFNSNNDCWLACKNKFYNQALEDFERKMAYFCFGLKASGGNLCRVDVVEDELQRLKRLLKR